MLRIGRGTSDAAQIVAQPFAQLADAPLMVERLCPDCAAHFAAVRGYLDGLGVAYELNPRLVRGLAEVGLTLWGGVLIAVSLAATGLSPVWWMAVPGCFGEPESARLPSGASSGTSRSGVDLYYSS